MSPPKVLRTNEEQLRRFCDRVIAMQSLPSVRAQTIKATFSIHVEAGKGFRSESQLENEEGFRSLLLEVRKFTLESGDVSFFRIASIVEQAITDDAMRLENRRLLRIWKEWLRTSIVQLDSGAGKHQTAGEWLDLLINGEWFHDDPGKVAEFNAMPADLQDIARASVVRLILAMVQIVGKEAELIQNAFAAGSFDFNETGPAPD